MEYEISSNFVVRCFPLIADPGAFVCDSERRGKRLDARLK